MKKIILIVGLLSVIGLLSWFIISDSDSDKPFQQVELSNYNSIVNNVFPKYFDTIMSVGLDAAGIKGVTVVFNELTGDAKSNFGSGELKAHIRYFNGVFYLFTDEMGRSQAIEILSHEIIHIRQYLEGAIIYENNELYWYGQIYSLDDVEYDDRPWEKEAFSLESDISNQVSNILIK